MTQLAAFNGNLAGAQSTETLGNAFVLTGSLQGQKQTVGTAVGSILIKNYKSVQVRGTSTANDGRAYSIRGEVGTGSGSGSYARLGFANDVAITNIGSGGVTLITADGTGGGIFTGSGSDNNSWNAQLGDVLIVTAGPVTLRHLVTGCTFLESDNSWPAKIGSGTIVAGGNISITGDISMYTLRNATPRGTLSLTVIFLRTRVPPSFASNRRYSH